MKGLASETAPNKLYLTIDKLLQTALPKALAHLVSQLLRNLLFFEKRYTVLVVEADLAAWGFPEKKENMFRYVECS